MRAAFNNPERAIEYLLNVKIKNKMNKNRVFLNNLKSELNLLLILLNLKHKQIITLKQLLVFHI
jgi:hypothetical protein